jgi:hypothetical protein
MRRLLLPFFNAPFANESIDEENTCCVYALYLLYISTLLYSLAGLDIMYSMSNPGPDQNQLSSPCRVAKIHTPTLMPKSTCRYISRAVSSNPFQSNLYNQGRPPVLLVDGIKAPPCSPIVPTVCSPTTSPYPGGFPVAGRSNSCVDNVLNGI